MAGLTSEVRELNRLAKESAESIEYLLAVEIEHLQRFESLPTASA